MTLWPRAVRLQLRRMFVQGKLLVSTSSVLFFELSKNVSDSFSFLPGRNANSCPRRARTVTTSVRFSTKAIYRTRTSTVTQYSKTVTSTKTVSIAKKSARENKRELEEHRDRLDVGGFSADLAGAAAAEGSSLMSPLEKLEPLMKRNNCPVCPSTVKLETKAGSRSGGQPCCPAVKTIFKTRTRTATTFKTVKSTVKGGIKTVTKTAYFQNVVGRVYVDVDNNGIYSSPPDIALSNSEVALVLVGKNNSSSTAAAVSSSTARPKRATARALD